MVEKKIISLHWGYSIGGVGKYGVLLDGAAKQEGLSMDHVCVRGQDWQVDNKTLSSLNADEILIRSRFDFSWLGKLCRLLRATSPLLLVTHGFNAHFAARAMRLMGCYKGPFVCSYHGLYHPTTRMRKLVAPWFNGFTEWHIRHSQGAVAVAEHSRNYLIGRGISPDLIEVIHNGIPDVQCASHTRQALRGQWGLGDEHIVIGVASRLDPVKGIEYLLTAFSRLSERHTHLRLVVVGTGAVESDLRRQAGDLGLGERVRFTGFRSDIAECLSAFDIFALPSLAEYHSIALLEAMRAGLAIVATDVGGNTESVRDGMEALVVPSADSDSLASALERLLEDAELRQRLGVAARDRFLAEFTESVMLQQTGKWLRLQLDKTCRHAAN